MKKRANWLLIPAVSLGLGACNQKKEPKKADAPATGAETSASAKEMPTTPAAPKVEAPKIGAEERAAKLGFARYLPKDTEVALAFYNGTKIADRVKGTRLWNIIQGEMGGGLGAGMEEEDGAEAEAAIPVPEEGKAVPEPGAEPTEKPEIAAGDDAPAAEGNPEEPIGPAALFGTEFTLALGKTTGEQTGNLLTVGRRMNYFRMRSLAKAFAAAVKSGDASGIEDAFSDSEELSKDLLKDPQSGIPLLEKAKMPPIYLAFRAKEGQRDAMAQQVSKWLGFAGMMGEMVEPVTIDAAGQKFEGFKIPGAKISASMGESREEMQQESGLDAETVDQLLAAVAKKDIVFASGTIGDYVLVFLGGSVDDLKLATDPKESLCGGDALAFSDAYASKELAAFAYGEKGATETLIKSAGGLGDITSGLRDGLAGSEGLGDTRDLEAMFQIVADREAALRKLAVTDGVGIVGYFEEGLKVESFGGTDNGMFAWSSPNKLGHLGDSEDVVFFTDMTGDATYDAKAREYVEALVETAYALTMKVAESPIEDSDIAQYKEMAKIFDTKFRPDMLALWDAASDCSTSLGGEKAIVIDLKGGAPSVPGVPQNVLDQAKIPRISFISPVTDRAKLSGSWDKMNTTLTGTLAKVSEMTGQEIPMQKPMSSESNGNTTWFFPMPFLTDDFVPSVTVGDKWFVASTSKNQALDLISKADAGGPASGGVHVSVNFKALQKYADETLKLVSENAEAITGSPMSETDKKNFKVVIEALGDLDKLTFYTRKEGSVLRSSAHFKTR